MTTTKIKEDIFQKVFEFYGEEVPYEKDLYSAKDNPPVPVRAIVKEFGSYKEFKREYNIFRVKQRNKKTPKDLTTTKGGKNEVK